MADPDHATFYLYREGEPVIKLATRVAGTPDVLLDDLPKGQNPAAPVAGRTRLSREAQRIIFPLVDMLDDIVTIEPRRCIDKLSGSNILFTRDGTPRLIGVKLVGYSDALAESNYESLANVIVHDILSTSPLEIPVEVNHLLDLMKHQALAMQYVIVNHSSLVPMEIRSYMYLSHFQYVYGIMYRSPDTKALLAVLMNLLFDPNWYTTLPARNRYLAGFIKRADYDPTGTKPGRIRGLEVMRCPRNGHEHPFDDALDLTSPFHTKFSSTDIAHMFYANLPLLLCSLSAALYRQGRLRYINPRPFFTSLPKPVAAPSDGFEVIEQGT